MLDSASSPHLARMGRVYDFIQDHLAEDLSVGRLAEVAILSSWHFQRVFQEFSGESAAAFVRRLRVERAADRLLIQKARTVDAVAVECGFGSAELLARHFQKRFHISPSAWRAATPEERHRTIRQALAVNRGEDPGFVQDEGKYSRYLGDQPQQGILTDLRLERRPERRVIYTRHFQGYDHEGGINAAFERLWHWAQPRGLLKPSTVALGIGLDNPWICDPARCRFLCCYSVDTEPEVGDGIGLRVIPGGLYALVGYEGPRDGLSWVYQRLYQTLLLRAGVEGVDDFDSLEYPSAHPSSFGGEDYSCQLALRVRSR